MIDFQDFVGVFRRLAIPGSAPIIAHASLSVFGEVQGGAQTLLEAMIQVYDTVVMPGFTYKTMVIPQVGPPNNGLTYGDGRDSNRLAQFFDPQMKVDRLMGITPELLRKHPEAGRSKHPILSFVGIHAGPILDSQMVEAPLKPVQMLRDKGGWVLLVGVGHEVNTSIHEAERLAGRKQFIRWALTPQGVVECGGFPGCSEGFGSLAPRLTHIARMEPLGSSRIIAIPLEEMIAIAQARVEADPQALLCDRAYCPRCEAVRRVLGLWTGAAGAEVED